MGKRRPNAKFTPMMSAELAERLWEWHEAALAGRRREETLAVEHLGYAFHVPPDVYPPHHLGLADLVLEEVKQGDRVLDMGTGSGVNAIAAASSRDVLAVDVNPSAVDAARSNAERNGVADRIHVRESDIFENVSGRFDVIIFDPPFRWFPARQMWERGTTDENYAGLTAFFDLVRDHLTQSGRVLLNFGTTGDADYLHHLISRAGLSIDELRRVEGEKDGLSVAYFAYRLTPSASVT
jgi:release factor glutamine methyltransferase